MVEGAAEERLPDRPRKGRGALSNAAGRYEPHLRERVDDGWGNADDEPPPLRTTVTHDASRSKGSRSNTA